MGLLRVLRAAGNLLATRATPENPTFNLRDPAAWDARGAEDAAGAKVSPRRALKDSAWWRGITLIANTVAKLPCHVYRREGEGKEREPSHPLYRLVHDEPNAEMSAFSFWQSRVGQAASLGNSYAYISRSKGGAVLELIPLDPEGCWPVRVGGTLSYAVQVNGDARPVPSRNILHFKGFSDDGLEGYPVWRMAAEELGVGLQARRHVSRVFKNGSSITLILQHPQTMKQEAVDRFLANWNKAYAGADNAFKTAILEEGMKAQPINLMSFKDAQMQELRNLHNREVANFLSLPPHKLGETTRSAYASLEMETQALLDDCIDPWLVMIEQELRRKLLSDDEKRADSHTIEFLRAALVRADMAARYAAHKSALAGVPFVTINEVRKGENLRPLPDGDRLIIPISVQDPEADPAAPTSGGGGAPPELPAGGEDDAPEPAAAEGDGGDADGRSAAIRARAAALLDDARRKMRRRLAEHVRRSRSPAKLGTFLEQLVAEHAPVLRSALGPAAEILAMAEGRDHAGADQREADALLELVRGALAPAVRAADPAALAAAVDAAAAQLETAA